ncbi:unnamed protein product [Anisakis simplex]|uniref:N(4)-(beta-N-acetylglucosaminyl)-L-asparaginase n=1 Tax=Anisakis simplex TaxID=6269 RepID=A0A0M3JSX3_ANISI|nr:unnamed protein product [Anisakis simplex]
MPPLSVILILVLFSIGSYSCWNLIYWKDINKDDSKRRESNKQMVISTWSAKAFQLATARAWKTLKETDNRIEALLDGLSECEQLQCDGTVGYGGSPDDTGETRLDALIFDGPGHTMGAVGSLRRIRSAARVAYAVMKYSKHSFLVGEAGMYIFRNVLPNPLTSCGPYKPNEECSDYDEVSERVVQLSHDTIGMIVVDSEMNISAGTSTNGAIHKIAGRIGDSPIPGAGAYVDNEIGAAAATGDGDILMRFLPSYQAVEGMRSGLDVKKSVEMSITRITRIYPNFSGAVIAVDKNGNHSAACHGMSSFGYSICDDSQSDHARVIFIDCI